MTNAEKIWNKTQETKEYTVVLNWDSNAENGALRDDIKAKLIKFWDAKKMGSK